MGGLRSGGSITRLLFPHVPLTPGELLLPPEVARHARVTRVRPGEQVEVLNLQGEVGVGFLLRWEKNGVAWVRVEEVLRERGEPPVPLTLALAVLHTAAFDWAVEKATEMGATQVIPVLCQRVQRGAHGKRVERWRRIAAAAVAQCGRARPPVVQEPVSLGELLAPRPGLRLVADREGGLPSWEGERWSEVLVLVGPEGGFTVEERKALAAAGFLPLALGPRILRAETAALSALAVVQAQLGWLWAAPGV